MPDNNERPELTIQLSTSNGQLAAAMGVVIIEALLKHGVAPRVIGPPCGDLLGRIERFNPQVSLTYDIQAKATWAPLR